MSSTPLPGNSMKSKEENIEKKDIKPVVTNARTKKKSEIKKFTDVFISDDINNVKGYIIQDVLIPAVKDVIEDIIVNGIRIILRGETTASKRGRSDKISYRNYYEKDNRRDTRTSERQKTRYSSDDIILDTRAEAEEVISRLEEIIDTYGVTSVADLYDLTNIPAEYTDNKYGWTDLRGASVARTREGFVLKLPKAIVLK